MPLVVEVVIDSTLKTDKFLKCRNRLKALHQNEMNAIPTMISFSVIKNHEFQTHTSISSGREGHLKNSDASSGTAGT